MHAPSGSSQSATARVRPIRPVAEPAVKLTPRAVEADRLAAWQRTFSAALDRVPHRTSAAIAVTALSAELRAASTLPAFGEGRWQTVEAGDGQALARHVLVEERASVRIGGDRWTGTGDERHAGHDLIAQHAGRWRPAWCRSAGIGTQHGLDQQVAGDFIFDARQDCAARECRKPSVPLPIPECTPSSRIRTRRVPEQIPAQRSRAPELIVVAALGIETYHEARGAEA